MRSPGGETEVGHHLHAAPNATGHVTVPIATVVTVARRLWNHVANEDVCGAATTGVFIERFLWRWGNVRGDRETWAEAKTPWRGRAGSQRSRPEGAERRRAANGSSARA